MRRERGFSWVGLVAIIAAVAALTAAAGFGLHVATSYVDRVRDTAFKAGEDKKDGEYKARDNEQLAAAHKQIVDLLLKNQGLERQLILARQTIEARMREDKENAAKAHDTTIARLLSGDLRLRDGLVEVGPCAALDRAGRAAEIGGPAAGARGATCARLSEPTERFLVGEAKRADDVVIERNACVAIAKRDREVINGLTAPPAGSSVVSPTSSTLEGDSMAKKKANSGASSG